MFFDHIIIHAKAGDGGRGCVAFRRETFVPKGGPSGGDGGKGGDVILEVSPHQSDFRDFYFQPHLRARRGEHGQGSNCAGRNAPDLVVPVPPGTLVYRLPEELSPGSTTTADSESDDTNTADGMSTLDPSDPPDSSDPPDLSDPSDAPDPPSGPGSRRKINPRTTPMELVADLVEIGQRVVLCKGGRGGLGNQHFATSTNQAPTYAQPGEKGEQGSFYLELKSLADVGFVGFPNAGKSTLLGALTNAKPLVGAYPFTTLYPHVGIRELPDYRRITFADIPGLIPGAHQGVGLGHDFLRHIERTKLLLFVLDMAGTENRDPADDFTILLAELSAYSPDLAARPRLIAANKCDHPDSEIFLPEFRRRFPAERVIPISAQTGAGLDDLVRAVINALPGF